MEKNINAFIKGDYKLIYKECKKGYLLIVHQEFKSGKHFDTVLCWVDNPHEDKITIVKKGE